MYFIINKMSRYLNQRANPFGPQIRCTKSDIIFITDAIVILNDLWNRCLVFAIRNETFKTPTAQICASAGYKQSR